MAQPVWNTSAGIIGTYPAGVSLTIILSASAVAPAVNIATYTIISGLLPNGLDLDTSNGVISGTPTSVSEDTTYPFVIRATDNFNNIRDRTFSIEISGSSSPSFTTPSGNILNVFDSTWVELPIGYSNPISTNTVSIRLLQGTLPPGLEINSNGIIRGYADKPVQLINYTSVTTNATSTSATDNTITVLSTTGFVPGRPVVFTGLAIGGIVASVTYYVKSVISNTKFTITTVVNGSTLTLSTANGYMTVTLPGTSLGQPTKISYEFTLKLESDLGNDQEIYNIIVTNQNLPVSEGGPGYLPNTRIPTIYNTRPPTYNIEQSPDYGFFLLPNNTGTTYATATAANLGQFQSDNFFSFQILGHDFDGDDLVYVYNNLPLGITGSNTGWISGTPIIAVDTISQYYFSVFVRKASNPAYVSSVFNYTLTITNDIVGNVTWITPTYIGQINNGTVSTLKVQATCDVDLKYRIVGGNLPANLSLLDNGEIAGIVSFQPGTSLTNADGTNTFTFTIEAYNDLFSVITSTRTFTLTVYQEFATPSDQLYIKASPSLVDRSLIETLLTDNTIIPTNLLYRPEDPNFGKASAVIYAHAYGIDPAYLSDYLIAVTRNHYWRNLTLGEIKTAIAKDENGNIIYEVVYSQIIDNLVNPSGVSISQSIYWPKPIDLNLGPWYSSSTSIYTSWVNLLNQQYYTSLTPGYAQTLYPNSLDNMRARVSQVIGSQTNYKLLPLWMTSQQSDGSTLGFTPAWVICYTKPGFSTTIKNNINTLWVNQYNEVNKLNQINFQIDRFTVDKSLTFNYDKNLLPNTWLDFPGATPPPTPIDSDNFYVLFPRKTILPNTPQSY